MPDAKDLIRTACDIIGVGQPETDWRIAPTEHAEMFKDKAPSLANTLLKARPGGLAKMYEDLNARAIRARDDFKRTAVLADWAIFWTASFAALLLMAAALQPLLGGQAGPWVVRVAGFLGIISGGFAAMWLGRVRLGALSRQWAELRAKAEAKRLAYFKAVMEEAPQTPLDQLLALEYTRRFLLDNQIDYFEGRGEKHSEVAREAVDRTTAAACVSSVFTLAAGAASMWRPWLAVIAGLGAIASAFSAMAMSRTAVNQDRRNADRYRAAEFDLWERKLGIDPYHKRTEAGDYKAVQEFFDPVFVVLEADHKAFLSQTEQEEVAIGDMEKRLDAAKEAHKNAVAKTNNP